jgi:hypothetical protein
MAKKKPALTLKSPTLKSLSDEIAALRAEVSALKEAASVTQLVSTAVDGPRRSEVAVDSQVIPMTGEFTRSGKRTVKLEPPKVTADLSLRGQIGTQTTFTIEINGKTQKREFVLTAEQQQKSFDFDFAEFGL